MATAPTIKDAPLSGDLAVNVSGLSLDKGRSLPGAADHMSGATSQASEGGPQKGAKGDKAHLSDHGSDGQVCAELCAMFVVAWELIDLREVAVCMVPGRVTACCVCSRRTHGAGPR